MPSTEQKILSRLVDIYERRNDYMKNPDGIRAVSFNVKDAFPDYTNQYNHTEHQNVNNAIVILEESRLITAEKNTRGDFTKVKLFIPNIESAYSRLNRVSKDKIIGTLNTILEKYHCSDCLIINKIIFDFQSDLSQGKQLPFGIGYDAEKLDGTLKALTGIVALKKETYFRNFSLAVFHDTKTFQKSYESTVQSILFDYSDTTLDKKRILELYNLYPNPTYVLLKGNAELQGHDIRITLANIDGGISLPESALDSFTEINVLATKVVTVENLTTYHDKNDSDTLYVYLGGFHNHSKEKLLKMIYNQNPTVSYYHEGDLDVFGFAILKSLIERTQIPFKPLNMDIETLSHFYEAGRYKELTAKDREIIKSGALEEYSEVLNFMLKHNCKVEQESLQAEEI